METLFTPEMIGFYLYACGTLVFMFFTLKRFRCVEDELYKTIDELYELDYFTEIHLEQHMKFEQHIKLIAIMADTAERNGRRIATLEEEIKLLTSKKVNKKVCKK